MYIPWAELLRKTFGFEIVCTKCKAQLRLIALIKTEDVARKILEAMHTPTDIPELPESLPSCHAQCRSNEVPCAPWKSRLGCRLAGGA
jgi:hypothetical protein